MKRYLVLAAMLLAGCSTFKSATKFEQISSTLSEVVDLQNKALDTHQAQTYTLCPETPNVVEIKKIIRLMGWKSSSFNSIKEPLGCDWWIYTPKAE